MARLEGMICCARDPWIRPGVVVTVIAARRFGSAIGVTLSLEQKTEMIRGINLYPAMKNSGTESLATTLVFPTRGDLEVSDVISSG